MLKKIFTIYDQKAEMHDPVFLKLTVGQALRDFTDAAQDQKTQLGQHPEDFTLMEIGVFNSQSGMIEPHNKPLLIASGNQCQAKPEPKE